MTSFLPNVLSDPPHPPTAIAIPPPIPPTIILVPEPRCRGRSLSRSPSRSSSRSATPSRIRGHRCFDRSRTPSSRRSPSRSRSRSRSRSCSPFIPSPPRCMTPQHYTPPIPCQWPSSVMIKCPVDILTFHYNKNMAYAPASKTYDVSII
jgi:hypothetical protein